MCSGKVGQSFVGETNSEKLSTHGAFGLCANVLVKLTKDDDGIAPTDNGLLLIMVSG